MTGLLLKDIWKLNTGFLSTYSICFLFTTLFQSNSILYVNCPHPHSKIMLNSCCVWGVCNSVYVKTENLLMFSAQFCEYLIHNTIKLLFIKYEIYLKNSDEFKI